jgi:hypothetical protein
MSSLKGRPVPHAMSAGISHPWRPVEDLPANWRDLASGELLGIWPTWMKDRKTLEEVSTNLMELLFDDRPAGEAPWLCCLREEPLTAAAIVETHDALVLEGDCEYRA